MNDSAPSHIRTVIHIQQMDCPTEEALLRKTLMRLSSVSQMDFNLMQRVLTVTHAPDALQSVLDAVRALGFTPRVAVPSQNEPVLEPAPHNFRRLMLAGGAALASEIAQWLGLASAISAGLALLAVLACGLSIYKKGGRALRAFQLNIHALMSIAVTGAFALGQWPEAAMVMVLFTIAEWLEARALGRARRAIDTLMRLAPNTALVQRADGGWQAMEAKEVAVGSIVRVAPGARIALDGVIVKGRSTVNQAAMTGESLPVEKSEGDPVFAGTVNGTGAFEYRTTEAASHTALARIIHAVERAQGAKAPTARFVDRFARLYTPAVLIIAFALALAGPWIWGGAWVDWIYKALVLLVIACPCALVISTPVTVVSGLAACARRGILIKGGLYLEEGRRLKRIAFDKTGTLTHGRLVQTDFEIQAEIDARACRALAASLAEHSDHPVSQAIAQQTARAGIQPHAADSIEALPGYGIRGVIDGAAYTLGNHRLIEALGVCDARLEARIRAFEKEGKTVAALLDARRALALFAVADAVKESSRAAMAGLHALGVKTVMLSGDNRHAARAIAQQVGIDEAQGELLPEDKLAAIERFSAGGKIGMAGDGINDAPALARADIGFAMGALGSDTAMETADVALMDDDLRKLPLFIRMSRATHAILIQNIVIALGIKAAFLILTLLGAGTMWMAVFADAGASLLVVGNGLRLLRARAAGKIRF